jgi:hypothetical protein
MKEYRHVKGSIESPITDRVLNDFASARWQVIAVQFGGTREISGVLLERERERDLPHTCPWCEACQSWHPAPRDAAHHKALMCRAPYP